MSVLLGKDSPLPQTVCKSVPVRVQENLSFVVSMDNVKDPLDLRADDNGVWVHKGIRTLWISVDSGGRTEILSRKGRPKMKISGGAKLYCMKKSYHALKTSEDFRRLIVTMEGLFTTVWAVL